MRTHKRKPLPLANGIESVKMLEQGAEDGNLTGYDTREDAIADNHRPRKVCKP